VTVEIGKVFRTPRAVNVVFTWYRPMGESEISWTRELREPQTVAGLYGERAYQTLKPWKLLRRTVIRRRAMMDKVVERGCGLDVHKASVAACVRIPGGDGKPVEYAQTFGTTTSDLLTLKDWLTSHGVTHVAMESTGVYWKPIYYILEDGFRLILVNAAHMKNVPGRKTDMKDCTWIAQLLEHGLLSASFVPPPPIRELRDLTRYRKSLIQDRASEANRLHKVLEDAGIKLSSVASDVLGVSGRAMLDALVTGTTDPAVLADLAKKRLREKIPALRKALEGRVRQHHAFLVRRILSHLDYLEESIGEMTERIGVQIAPFEEAVARLDSIPGVDRKTAEVMVAEIGTDMSRFPDAKHLASWAGMCPGNNESAGKRKSGKTRKGSKWLRIALVEAALAASRSKDTYLAAQYRRLYRQRGHRKAVVAVGHSILVIAYHLIKDKTVYQDLGADFFLQRDRQSVIKRCLRQLHDLGQNVVLQPAPAMA
jgi:transposase